MSTDFNPMELSRKAKRGYTRSSGTRVFLCKYEDRNGDWAPAPGVSRYTDGLGWPACWEDSLVCVDLDYDYDGPEQSTESVENREFETCQITATYETFEPLLGNWDIESDGRIELADLGIGRAWSDGTPSGQPVVIPVFQEELIVSRVFIYSAAQMVRIREAQGSVNANLFWAPWGESFAPETLRFDSFKRRVVRPDSTGLMFNHITFHFTVSNKSHNVVWRAPLQARDSAGLLLWEDSAPVFVGTGGWDRFATPLYPGYDFASIVRE